MSKNKNLRKGVIYSRVNCLKETERYVSTCKQLLKCKELASQNKISIIKTFIDKGVSGLTLNRPSLIEMINYCQEETIQYLVVLSADRLSRGIKTFRFINKKMNELNIEIITVN